MAHEDLKKRVLGEMTVDHRGALERNFELAKKHVKITQDGKVELIHKDRMGGKPQIVMYMIGKLYAKEAGLAEAEDVGNEELTTELGIPGGSLRPWLAELRKENKVRAAKRGRYTYHAVQLHVVEKELRAVDVLIQGARGEEHGHIA